MTDDDRSAPRRSLEEIRAELRKFERAQRDERLRRGRAKPRTLREFEIFAEYLRRHSAEGREGAPDGD